MCACILLLITYINLCSTLFHPPESVKYAYAGFLDNNVFKGLHFIDIFIILIGTRSQINSLDLFYLLDLCYLLLIGGMEHVEIGKDRILKHNTITLCHTGCVSWILQLKVHIWTFISWDATAAISLFLWLGWNPECPTIGNNSVTVATPSGQFHYNRNT